MNGRLRRLRLPVQRLRRVRWLRVRQLRVWRLRQRRVRRVQLVRVLLLSGSGALFHFTPLPGCPQGCRRVLPDGRVLRRAKAQSRRKQCVRPRRARRRRADRVRAPRHGRAGRRRHQVRAALHIVRSAPAPLKPQLQLQYSLLCGIGHAAGDDIRY